MVKIKVDYEGGLHTRAVHGPSSATLQTDAPVAMIPFEGNDSGQEIRTSYKDQRGSCFGREPLSWWNS